MERIITNSMMKEYHSQLVRDEYSSNTIQKYLRDLNHFHLFIGENKEITKESVISYKEWLSAHYRISSANSMLTALNCFWKWAGWTDFRVKTFKVQTEVFRADEKSLTVEEYHRLADTARKQKWLHLILVTLCSTGIRIGELPFITVESLSSRQAIVRNKGKSRRVILPLALCKKLRQYAIERGITQGSIFVTKSGKPIDGSNIRHAMKKLAEQSGIAKTKVFPHNFRHLFAVQHYKKNHDLSGLASILGHSSINTTRIYTMVTAGQMEADINALGLVV